MQTPKFEEQVNRNEEVKMVGDELIVTYLRP